MGILCVRVIARLLVIAWIGYHIGKHIGVYEFSIVMEMKGVYVSESIIRDDTSTFNGGKKIFNEALQVGYMLCKGDYTTSTCRVL